MVVQNASDLTCVIFHLLNFTDYDGKVIRSVDATETWDGRVVLEADLWRITIDKVPNYSELYETLKSSSGYAITNVCKLERMDGNIFSVDEAEDVLDSLHWFLSFTKGFFAPPVLPVGFDAAGNRVWESWQNVRATRWKSVPSWFSTVQPARELSDVFGSFYNCWKNPLWRDELKHIIHWYVTSNTNVAALEGSVVLAQTGLELLTWVLLVEDKQKFSANNFDRKSAAYRLTELLKYVGMSDAIPTTLPNLLSFASTRSWTSGANTLTGFRNDIEHPNRRSGLASASWEVRCEIVTLSLWYLELGLLHLFSYGGQYANRTSNARFIGQDVEVVPWIASP